MEKTAIAKTRRLSFVILFGAVFFAGWTYLSNHYERFIISNNVVAQLKQSQPHAISPSTPASFQEYLGDSTTDFCGEYSIKGIKYPAHWRGINRGDEAIDILGEGDLMSIYNIIGVDLFNAGSGNFGFETDSLKAPKVPSSVFPQYELPMEYCSRVSLDGKEYFTCNAWYQLFSWDSLVSTECEVLSCGGEVLNSCLFPDYTGALWDYQTEQDSYCIFNEDLNCNRNLYIENVYNYYNFINF